MAERRRGARLPDPSRMVDRAAEAPGDAGDLGAELLATGVDAVTSLIGGLTSAPEEIVKAPRRRGNQGTGSAGPTRRVGATVKRAAKAMASENRKTARTEARAAKKVTSGAKNTARKAVKSSKRAAKSVTRTSKSASKSSSRARKK
ncbi:MAG TPA: hypothetical protein VJU84_03885 [Pyrinomonadaceae bacterium]|nr:hypothetical protein [Pyrinomonadaceae bacterium]